MLDFFTLVLGTELRSLCLFNKHFVQQATSPGPFILSNFLIQELASAIPSALTSYSLHDLPARNQVFRPIDLCVMVHTQPIRVSYSSGVCSLKLSSLPTAFSSRPEVSELSAP